MTDDSMISPAGWCAPSAQVYAMAGIEDIKQDPEFDLVEAMTGVNPNDIRVKRGGIEYKERKKTVSKHPNTVVETIGYSDDEALKKVLVGRKVTAITETEGSKLFAGHGWEGDESRYTGHMTAEELGYNYDGRGDLSKVIEYHLDDGSILRAHAADGGCACSNGCFTVDISDVIRERLIGATIMNVQTEEVASEYKQVEDPETGQMVWSEVEVPGKEIDHDSGGFLRLFVYADLAESSGQSGTGEAEEKLPMVESAGADNGYYGWGYHITIERPKTEEQD